MSHYEVTNASSGHSFGVYEADSPEAAIEACCIDAGYSSKADADEVTGGGNLVATEVSMLTIYVYDNETGKQVGAIQGRNNAECESRADDKWGSNDYTWDYINVARINVG